MKKCRHSRFLIKLLASLLCLVMVCPIFQNIIVRAEQNQENIGERLDGDYACPYREKMKDCSIHTSLKYVQDHLAAYFSTITLHDLIFGTIAQEN